MLLETTYLSADGEGLDKLRAELDGPDTLVLVLSGLDRIAIAEPLHKIRERFPRAVLVGCSTAGEVLGSTMRDGGVAVAVVRFDGTQLTVAGASIVDEQASFGGGEELARKLIAPSLAGVLVLADGLNVNGSELVRGLDGQLPKGVPVIGGLAGDGDRFEQTWVIIDGEVATGKVAAIGFYGDRVRIGHGSGSGWDVFGEPQLVTDAQANVVRKIDRRPALDLYEDSLGDLAAGLPSSGLFFPLALSEQPDDEEYVIRTLLGVDRAAKSLTFAGDIPTGWHVHLMRASYPFQRLVDGAREAATIAAEGVAPAGPRLGFAVSCVGRRLVLGNSVDRELDAALRELPTGTRLIGFYSYGEISPLSSGRCGLHNQTMTLAVISER